MSQKRIKTPVILQMESSESGSTALAIIMASYGKFVPAEKMRSVCSVSRDGTTPINIVKAARYFGMTAEGCNRNKDELKRMAVPFIVLWDSNRFLVIEGFHDKRVFVNDPARGHVTMTWDEFENKFAGVVLDIRPGKEFVRDGRPEASTLSMVWQQMKRSFFILCFIIILSLLLVVAKASIPLFTKVFIDSLLLDRQTGLIPFIFIGIAVAVIIQMGLTWLQKKTITRLRLTLEVRSTLDFMWHLLHVPMRYFQQRAPGDIVQRQVINEKVAMMLCNEFPVTLMNALEIVSYSLIMLLLSWPIGLCVLLLLLCNGLFLFLIKAYLTNLNRRLAQEKGRLSGIETNGLQIIETIKAETLENQFFGRWVDHYTQSLQSEQTVLRCNALLTLVPEAINLMISFVIICLGSWMVLLGKNSIGTIIALQAFALMIVNPLTNCVNFTRKMTELRGDLARINDVKDTRIDEQFMLEKTQDAAFLDDVRDKVLEVESLTYSYSPLDPPILHELSFSLNAGQRMAITGVSGGGKSTLAQLICGLSKPDSGQILLRGQPLATLSRQILSEFMVYVDQHHFFVQASLRDNLTWFNPDISDSDIYEALAHVCIDQDIHERGGLDIMVAEGGSNFSGGQCQRLEIARALLRKPQLLILDEVSSALDPLTESLIYRHLTSLQATTLVIAHRLQAVTSFEQILVLDSGRIVEQGTHAELMARQGFYYEQARMEDL